MADKAAQKNKNSAVAGRYWGTTNVTVFRTGGIKYGEEISVGAARKMAADNLRLVSKVKPLPLGRG